MMENYSPGVGMSMECVPLEMKTMLSDRHKWRLCRTFFLLTVGLVLDIASFFVKTKTENRARMARLLALSQKGIVLELEYTRLDQLSLWKEDRINFPLVDCGPADFVTSYPESIATIPPTSNIKRDGLKTFLKCYHDFEDQYSISSM